VKPAVVASALRGWWNPGWASAEAFLAEHPHLGVGNAYRVLADVNGAVSRGECARTVDAIAMRIRWAFPEWFVDDLDAARHAVRVLRLDVPPAPAGDEPVPGPWS
jgi:hypothetical protein